MSLSLLQAGEKERSLRDLMRREVQREISKRQLSRTTLARRLNLLPSGAEALMERDKWSFETILWVAESLQMELTFNLKSKNDTPAR